MSKVFVKNCPCGKSLECPEFTNRCACGRSYNWAGQELAPPSQWGEETGERFTDDGEQIIGFGPEWEDPPVR